jgi:hypothetical protein
MNGYDEKDYAGKPCPWVLFYRNGQTFNTQAQDLGEAIALSKRTDRPEEAMFWMNRRWTRCTQLGISRGLHYAGLRGDEAWEEADLLALGEPEEYAAA